MNQSPLDSDTAVPDAIHLSMDACRAFWHAFLQREQAFSCMDPRECVEQANMLLAAHAPELALEVEGGKDETPRDIVLTAHGNKEQFANVLALVQAKPTFMHFLGGTGFRQRSQDGVFEIGMEGFSLSTQDLEVGLYADRGLVGLELRFMREIPMDMVEHARHMAFIMLDHVIGEYDFSVRVGPVDFVEALSDDIAEVTQLDQLPSTFDRFWRNALKHTGEWPLDESNHQWVMLEFKPREGEEKPKLMALLESATALATRADLTHCLDVDVDVSSDGALDRARDLEEGLMNAFQRDGRGIFVLSIVMMEQGRRVCRFYLDDPERGMQAARAICEQHGFRDAEMNTWFDPSWDAYLGYLPESAA